MNAKNRLTFLFFLLVFLSLPDLANAQKNRRATSSQKTAVNAKGILSIEAGLIYKSGDVKPVARTQFYLLDENLEIILKGSGIKLFEPGKSYVSHYAVFNYGRKKYGITDELTIADNAIKPHIIATMTTDFSGKGEFTSVKTGKYYLMATGGAGQQSVIWNVPIDIKAGKQSLILDNNNAAEIF